MSSAEVGGLSLHRVDRTIPCPPVLHSRDALWANLANLIYVGVHSILHSFPIPSFDLIRLRAPLCSPAGPFFFGCVDTIPPVQYKTPWVMASQPPLSFLEHLAPPMNIPLFRNVGGIKAVDHYALFAPRWPFLSKGRITIPSGFTRRDNLHNSVVVLFPIRTEIATFVLFANSAPPSFTPHGNTIFYQASSPIQ